MEEYKAVIVQLNQRVDTVESTVNKRIDGSRMKLPRKLTTCSIPSLG